MGSRKMFHCMCIKTCGFSTMVHHLILLVWFEVRGHLDQRFGQTWIGHGGPIAWPAYLPNLTQLDYFLWGHMKSLVYETPVNSEEDLLAWVMAAADVEPQGIGHHVYKSMVGKYRVCVEVAGCHIEPFL